MLNRKGIRKLLAYYTRTELCKQFKITRPSLNTWLESSVEPKHDAVTKYINDTIAALLKTI